MLQFWCSSHGHIPPRDICAPLLLALHGHSPLFQTRCTSRRQRALSTTKRSVQGWVRRDLALVGGTCSIKSQNISNPAWLCESGCLRSINDWILKRSRQIGSYHNQFICQYLSNWWKPSFIWKLFAWSAGTFFLTMLHPTAMELDARRFQEDSSQGPRSGIDYIDQGSI